MKKKYKISKKYISPGFLGSTFVSSAPLTSVNSVVTLVAGTSTVGVDDEGVSRVGNGGNGKPDPRGIGIPPGWLVSGVENGGNGKPDPGGIGIPPGWLVPGAAWPIIVLKTCCIAYL